MIPNLNIWRQRKKKIVKPMIGYRILEWQGPGKWKVWDRCRKRHNHNAWEGEKYVWTIQSYSFVTEQYVYLSESFEAIWFAARHIKSASVRRFLNLSCRVAPTDHSQQTKLCNVRAATGFQIGKEGVWSRHPRNRLLEQTMLLDLIWVVLSILGRSDIYTWSFRRVNAGCEEVD